MERISNSLLVLLCLMGMAAHANTDAPQVFTYEGRLYDINDKPIAENVTFQLQIYNQAENCLLYEEVQTLNLTSSEGRFVLEVGSPTGAGKRSGSDPGFAMWQVFKNTGTLAAPAGTCPGTPYAPTLGEKRKLKVTVTPASTGVAEVLTPSQTITSAPSAMMSQSLQGIGKDGFVQVTGNITQTIVNDLSGKHSELMDLANGVSTQYLQTGGAVGSNLIYANNQLAVGTSTPATGVELEIQKDDPTLRLEATDGNSGTMAIQFFDTAGNDQAQIMSTEGTNGLTITTGGTAALSIDASQNATFSADASVSGSMTVAGTIQGGVYDNSEEATLLTSLTGCAAACAGAQWMNSDLKELRYWDGAAIRSVGSYSGAETAGYVLTSNGAGTAPSWQATNDTTKLPLAGGTMSGAINMNNNAITNLPTPTLPGHAVNKSYADANVLGQPLTAPSGSEAGKSIRWNVGATAWEYFTPSTGAVNSVSVTAPISNGGTAADPNIALNFSNGLKNSAGNLEVDLSSDLTFSGGQVAIAVDGVTSTHILDGTIDNVDINASADIARSKLASGTANRVLVNDGSGVMSESASIDATELSYLDGVTSNIQTQLDSKQGSIGYTPVNKAGDNMTGNLTMSTQGEVRFEDDAGGQYISLKAPTGVTTYGLTLPATGGSANDILQTDASGNLSWVAIPSAPVTSVHGRTGAVVSATSDYAATQIDNTAAGNISSTNVQAAINELDTEKVATTRTLTTAADSGLTGGGDLSANRSLSVDINSTTAEATADDADSLLIYDNSAGALRKMSRADFISGIDSNTTYSADGNGIEESSTVFSLELDGTTLSKSATGLKVNAIGSTEITDGSIANADISSTAAISRNKLDVGSANRIVVNNGSGVMTDAAAITANRALISNASGIPVASSVTNTELGYLSGVSSALQTQIDGKVDKAGDNMTGNLTMSTQGEVRFEDDAGGEYISIQAPAGVTTYGIILPATAGNADDVLQTDASGNLSWVALPSAPVTSVHGRTGAVVSAASDYNASQIDNTPAGSVAATDVQAAIDELDSEKVATTRTLTTAANSGLTGGGDLSANRSLSVDINGTTAEATADNADSILIYDSSAAALRKMSRADFVSGIDTNTTYTADGSGIELSGTTFSLELNGTTLTKGASGLSVNIGTAANTVAAGDDSRFPASSCASGNHSRFNGTSWVCEPDADSGASATSTNTANTIVKRNGSGDFSAGIITADLIGDVQGNVTGNVTGTASNVTGTVAIANGGTGQTTATAAFNALAPTQTGNSGKYLTTDGSTTSWATVAGDNLGNHTATSNIILGSNYLSGDGGNEGISVDSTGKVGVGTASPQSQLHVYEDSGIVSRLRIQDGNSTAGSGFAELLLQDNGSPADQKRWGLRTTSGVSGNFMIGELNDAETVFTHRLTIDHSGNVGIGTTSPNAKLTVEGAMTLDQLAADPTGTAGYGSLYTKADGKLYYRDGTGTVTDIIAGATGGTITALTGDVTASGSGSVAATVATVGGVTAANVASGANLANAATNANTASTIVKRDASGNFSAGTITANLTGNVTGNLTGNVTGNVSGTAANVTGTVAIANGGTGQTTATAAFNALAPTQTGNSGKFLTTNGTTTSWASAVAPTRTLTAGAGLTGGGDLSADRTFDVGAGAGISVAADSISVDISGTTAETVVNDADQLLIYDASASALRKMTRANFLGGFVGVSADGLDFTELKDALTLDASTDISVTGTNVLSVTNTGTGDSFVVNDQAADTTPFVIDANGNVGVGTSTPGSKLEANGLFRVGSATMTWPTSGAGLEIGYDTATDLGYIQPYNRGSGTWGSLYLGSGNVGIGTASPASTLHVIVPAITTPSVTTYGTRFTVDTNPSAASTGSTYGVYNYASKSGANTHTTVIGTYNFGDNAGTGDVGNIYGSLNYARNNGTSTVANMRGSFSYAYNNTTGTVTNAYGVFGQANNINASGVVTNAYAGYFATTLTAGTITNGYGVFIGDTAGTNQWGLYQSGATDTNYFAGNVGIGTTAPAANLHVNTNGTANETKFSIGANYGSATNDNGMHFYAYSNGHNYVDFKTETSGKTHFRTGQGTELSYAREWMTVDATTGNVGIGNAVPAQKLDVGGGVQATAYYYTSDARLKENVQDIDGLEKILKMRGVTFNWIEDGKPEVGLIAQEVERVIPELVYTNPETGFKSVKYGNIVAPLIESVKALHAENEELRAEVSSLRSEMEEMKEQIRQIQQQLSK